MPAAAILKIKVVCKNLPGKRFHDVQYSGARYDPVFLGIQCGRDVIEAVPGDSCGVIFRPEFNITQRSGGKPNFTGPFAQGTPDDRFFYLSWGVRKRPGQFEMFRRLKIGLSHLDWPRVKKSMASGKPLEVHLKLTSPDGSPLCARPPKTHIRWK